MITIIDLEFTGLDNTFITDNEITQVKLMNLKTGEKIVRNFFSKKEVSSYDRVFGRIESECYNIKEPVFTKEIFESIILELGANLKDELWGYSNDQDNAMLKKYGIPLVIKDMQERMRLCSEYEFKMATGSAKMECAYYLLTDKIPPTDTHYDGREIELLKEMYLKIAGLKTNKYYTVMPYGHCAGMPIKDYVIEYRRAADGYRFNNSNMLSDSLTEAISEIIEQYTNEFDDEDEF